MTKEQLYESINELSDTVLEKSEKSGIVKWRKKPWIALAACLCVVIFTVAVLTDRPQEVQEIYDGFFYNDGQEVLFLTDEPYGRYSEELNARELAAVLPEEIPDWMDCEAYGRFSKEKELVYVEMELATTIPELNVRVILGENVIGEEWYNGLEYAGKGKPTISRCKDVEYILYRGQYRAGGGEDRFMFTATTQINGNDILLEMYGNWRLEEQAKVDFEAILKSFATYPEGEPDLTAVVSDSEPVWYDEDLTVAQAKADPDFGAYLPDSLEEEAEATTLRRMKDRTMDTLLSVWNTPGGFANWNISHYDSEDERIVNRLVSVADKKKYDWSRNPNYRTMDMPEELLKILESPVFLAEEVTLEVVQARKAETGEDEYEIVFDLIYDGVKIHIFAVNTSPEWVYEQIQNLRMDES